MQRFRITYNKGASLQYIGNLDLHKVWERYLRRARIPLAYTQGFHPQPHIQQAAPLPLGFLSENDLLDVWVQSENWPPAEFLARLHVTHQPGIEIISIADIPLNSPSLPTLIISSLYRVILLDPYDADDLKDRLENLQKQSTILRTRRNKTYDLRPLIEHIDLFLNPINQCAEFRMQLAAREGATGRPDEVIGELGLDPYAARYIRTGFIMKE